MKIEEHDSLWDHLLEIKYIRDQLKVIDRKVEEEDLVIITSKSLKTLIENFVEILNITSKDIDLTFEQLSNNLLQNDKWKKVIR